MTQTTGISTGWGIKGAVAPRQAPGPATPSDVKVTWARHLDEVRAVQRLRYDVFAREMGARLHTRLDGHDVDLFDDYCEHLLVTDTRTDEVIGTYRVLTPAQAKRAGSTYSDTEFDLTRLRMLRHRMVELGRSCVHADYRQGAVIMALWAALAEFMGRNQLDIMIGCASIPMQIPGQRDGVAGGHAAASIWLQLRERYLAPIEYQVLPRLPLPVDELEAGMPAGMLAEPPALSLIHI